MQAHLLSLATALAVIANLTFWMTALVMLSLAKWLTRSPKVNDASEYCYRAAARFDTWWMTEVVGIRIKTHGRLPDHPTPVIICNHRSWMDIPVLQAVVTSNGPILKFLIKRELRWVPIVGWICFLLNFPALRRGQGSRAREKDKAGIISFSNEVAHEPGALVLFPEGTRFRDDKRTHEFNQLLPPKIGGLATLLDNLPADTPVIDLTISYHRHADFWSCLGGACKEIDVTMETTLSAEIPDYRAWLNSRWHIKDQLLLKSAYS